MALKVFSLFSYLPVSIDLLLDNTVCSSRSKNNVVFCFVLLLLSIEPGIKQNLVNTYLKLQIPVVYAL